MPNGCFGSYSNTQGGWSLFHVDIRYPVNANWGKVTERGNVIHLPLVVLM
jgi:hypothetical protein